MVPRASSGSVGLGGLVWDLAHGSKHSEPSRCGRQGAQVFSAKLVCHASDAYHFQKSVSRLALEAPKGAAEPSAVRST